MNKGFIDRGPLSFVGGIFMLLVGLLAKSIPLISLAIFDIVVSIVFFMNPDAADKNSVKFIVYFTYGALILWTVLWLMSKIPA